MATTEATVKTPQQIISGLSRTGGTNQTEVDPQPTQASRGENVPWAPEKQPGQLLNTPTSWRDPNSGKMYIVPNWLKALMGGQALRARVGNGAYSGDPYPRAFPIGQAVPVGLSDRLVDQLSQLGRVEVSPEFYANQQKWDTVHANDYRNQLLGSKLAYGQPGGFNPSQEAIDFNNMMGNGENGASAGMLQGGSQAWVPKVPISAYTRRLLERNYLWPMIEQESGDASKGYWSNDQYYPLNTVLDKIDQGYGESTYPSSVSGRPIQWRVARQR